MADPCCLCGYYEAGQMSMVDTPVLPGSRLSSDRHEIVTVCYECSGEVLHIRQILDILKRRRDWVSRNLQFFVETGAKIRI